MCNSVGVSYQWYNNNVAIAGATGSTYQLIPDLGGKFTVVVTDANSCQSASSVYIVLSGIEQAENVTSKVMVFPNPGSETINIISSIKMPASIIFTDVLGREVLKQTLTTNNEIIDVSRLDNGIYMYSVTNGEKEGGNGKWVKSLK